MVGSRGGSGRGGGGQGGMVVGSSGRCLGWGW